MFLIYSVNKCLFPKPWESSPNRGQAFKMVNLLGTWIALQPSHTLQIHHHDVNFTIKG